MRVTKDLRTDLGKRKPRVRWLEKRASAALFHHFQPTGDRGVAYAEPLCGLTHTARALNL